MLTQTDANPINYFASDRRKANPIGFADTTRRSIPYRVCVELQQTLYKGFCQNRGAPCVGHALKTRMPPHTCSVHKGNDDTRRHKNAIFSKYGPAY